MSENKEKKLKKESKMSGERKFYLFTAIGCAAVLIAIIVIAIAVSSAGNVETPSVEYSAPQVEAPKEDFNEAEKPDENKPVVVLPEEMGLPMSAATVTNDYGFFHNVTLNHYTAHEGVDFKAEVGAEVKASKSGKIESINKDDLLLGTEIVVDHGDGLKTVYRFVTEREGLKVGDEVKKGEVIATVAEPSGREYKDGPHLHFEVLENGKQVDPTLHLTLEEK